MGEETNAQATDPQAQLYTAMAAVLGKVSRVKKNGRNDFHKYDYVTEGDLVDALRTLLSEHGISFWPSVASYEEEPIQNARGKTEFKATVQLATTFAHSSGGTMTTMWVGQGMDASDKAFYKAYTGAVKYALMKTFLVSTGDDPELDVREVEAPQRRQPARKAPRKQAPQKPPAQTPGARLGRLENLCREADPNLANDFLVGWAKGVAAEGHYEGPADLVTACEAQGGQEADKLIRLLERKTLGERKALMGKKLAEKASEEAA